MGKLAIMSDLHVDINRLAEPEFALLVEVLREKQITRVHFAGDTANKIATTLAVNHYFEQAGFPVTFNLGNHEMADLSGEEAIEHFPDHDFLNLRTKRLNEQTVLLGLNGWYDYQFSELSDPQQISAMKNLYWYDRNIKRAADDLITNQKMLTAVKTVLDDLAQKKQQVVIATHFVPQAAFIVTLTGKYQVWNKLNAFLGSRSLGELFDQYDNLQQVVFGHTHRRFPDQVIHGTRYSCRPFGYFYEWRLTRDFVLANHLVTEYNPMKLRPVIRQHQPAFDQYRNAHLKIEFAQAMTIVDY